MSHVRRLDHVGITVADLDTVTAFFVGLGLEVEGTRMLVEGRTGQPGPLRRHPGPRAGDGAWKPPPGPAVRAGLPFREAVPRGVVGFEG
jgi:catechol 2,3-dioxygenase-like lactoylglutathione lyase family enzyme